MNRFATSEKTPTDEVILRTEFARMLDGTHLAEYHAEEEEAWAKLLADNDFGTLHPSFTSSGESTSPATGLDRREAEGEFPCPTPQLRHRWCPHSRQHAAGHPDPGC